MRPRFYPCPRCNGEGEILTGYVDGQCVEMTPDEYRNAESDTDEMTDEMTPDICPDCDGTGKVTEEYFNFMGI